MNQLQVNAKLNVKATIFKDEDFKDALTGNPFRPKYTSFFFMRTLAYAHSRRCSLAKCTSFDSDAYTDV